MISQIGAIFRASALTLTLVSLGCTSAGVRDRSQVSATAPSGGTAKVVSSPLSARVSEPGLLATVNSLYIAMPVVRTQGIDPQAVLPLIQNAAERELGLKVIPHQRSDTLRRSSLTGNRQQVSAAGATSSGADARLDFELLDYTERSGSSAGGDRATVSFIMTIDRNADGKEVWQGTFYLHQEPLTDNLFKIGDHLGKQGVQGAKSAHEILEGGIVTALRDFGYRREQQFVRGGKH